MSLYDQYMNPKGGVLCYLLYTLLSTPLESLREEWSSNARPIFHSLYQYSCQVPERVKEIVIGQHFTNSPFATDPRLPIEATPTFNTQPHVLSTHESDPLVINAFNIVEELTTPNSNLAGRILIECSKGELNVVKDLSSKAEAAGQKLFLQPMLITALVFNHIEVAKFCIEKGASTDGDVEVAAWSTRSKESFELLFPLDIFSWSRHREYLDNLLYDCFDRLPKTSNTDNGVTESEVRSLAEFLFEHGAKVQSYTAKLSSFRWPTLMPFLLSHISQEECKEGVLIHAIDESIKYHSENEDLIKLLLSHSADANIPANVMWLAVSRRLEIVKLLLAHGIPLTEPRLLHEAALSGKADIISFLLDNGLSVNRRDTKGYFGVYSYQDPPFPNYGYALHYAVYMAQPEAVRVLLERGADPILRGVAGATVFEMPVGWSYHPEERKNEVKRLLGLVRDEPVEDIPKIIQRDRAERAGAHVEL